MSEPLYLEYNLSNNKLVTRSLLFNETETQTSYFKPVFLSEEDRQIFIGGSIDDVKTIVDKTINNEKK